MPAVRDDVKKACNETGHSIADLAREAGLLYPRLSGAVNGYWLLKPAEEEIIRRIVAQWEHVRMMAETELQKQTLV